MKIEFLGTGGAITIPRPGCDCPICVEARRNGSPYARSGPSLFVHGPDVLIDTPEEIKDQLNRAGIGAVAACLYSHWHPDHTMGRRVWEMNQDWRHWPPRNRTTDIYLPQQVAADFKTWLGTWDHLAFFEKQGLVRLIQIPEGESITLNGTKITPIRLAQDFVYAFLFEEHGKRVLIAMDELLLWSPPKELQGVDLAVLPMGITEFNPLTGERHIPAEHPILKVEATFDQTLDIVRQLQPGRAILTHIEEPDGVSYADLRALEPRLQAGGLPVSFAYDGLQIEL